MAYETIIYEKDNGIVDDVTDVTETVARIAPLATHALEVPFRSFGAVLEIDDPALLEPGPLAESEIITMQWTGAHGASSALAGAVRTMTDVFEFREAHRRSPWKGNNVAADAEGNIAYVLSGELPLRADLEAGQLDGDPPYFVRDGSGIHNWLPDPNRTAGQSIPYRVVPFEELASRIKKTPFSPRFSSACVRETLGSGITMSLSGARPTVTI